MGFYIETPGNRDKAGQIAKQFNGQIVSYTKARDAMKDSTRGVIVVVHNAFFEAAGFAFSEDEFDAFTRLNDAREKEFVIISRNDAEKASGYKPGGDYR